MSEHESPWRLRRCIGARARAAVVRVGSGGGGRRRDRKLAVFLPSAVIPALSARIASFGNLNRSIDPCSHVTVEAPCPPETVNESEAILGLIKSHNSLQ